MKLRPILFTLVAITLPMTGSAIAAGADESVTVRVMSRSWAVTQVAETPVLYRATRDWNNLNPFGPPARLRTTQAIAAIQKATGCQVIRKSMYQNISGQFYAQVQCR